MKKILFMIILIIIAAGCAGEKKTTENTDVTNTEKRDVIVSSLTTDAGISLRIISKPDDEISSTQIIDTNKVVDVSFLATQTGYKSSDFTYHYEVKKDGNIDAVNSLGTNVYTHATNVRLQELIDTVSQYSFEVWSYNTKTGKKSPSGEGFTFRVMSTTGTAISENVVLNSVTTDKKILYPGDTFQITYSITNQSTTDQYLAAKSTFSGQQTNVWTIKSTDAPAKITAGQTLEIKEVYTLSETYISSAGNPLVNKHIITSLVNLNSNEATNSINNSIEVIIKERANIVLDNITTVAQVVEPGQSNIRIDYAITNNGNNSAYIKEITPRFITADGQDVSKYWTETATNNKNPIVEGSGGTIVINKIYTLSTDAVGGDLFIDAGVKLLIGDSYGLELSYDNFRIQGKIKVQSAGTASIDAWIALPEGAKNGELYQNQEVTIYGIVNYSGTVSLSQKGSFEIVWSEIDGASLTAGEAIREDITLNKQFQWTLRAGTKPIQGNIYIRVKEAPVSVKTNMPIAFTTREKIIPIKVIPNPVLLMTSGVEEDNYGAKDGIVKAGTVEKIYVLVENTTATKYTGNVKVKLGVSQLEGCELAAGEVAEKTVVPGIKTIWSVKVPDIARNGSVVFDKIDSEIDPKTGEKPLFENLTTSVKIGSVPTGTIQLQEVKCDWTTVKPGVSGIPIVFVLENTGSSPIKITDLQGIFTKNGIDVSSKFILTNKEDFYGTIIPAKTGNIEIRTRFKMVENMLDETDIIKNVRIGGIATAVDTVMGEVLIDNISTYDGWIYVIDIVPPVLVVNEEMTAKVGEPVLFDASKSTDNLGITSYSWDYDDADNINNNTLADRGAKVYHTYTKAGVYRATISINDGASDIDHFGNIVSIKANGPVTKTIIVTVE